MHLSKEFFELIKAIGESKSKQEEDRIIANEIITLKKKLEVGGSGGGPGGPMISPVSPIPSMASALGGGPGGKGGGNALSSKKKAREFLVRLLYVEMLGHDGSFGFIKAVVSAIVFCRHSFKTGASIVVCWDDVQHLSRMCTTCEDQKDSRPDRKATQQPPPFICIYGNSNGV